MSTTSFADVMADPGNTRRTVKHRVCFSSDVEQQYLILMGDLEDALRLEQEPKKASRSGNPARRLGQGARTSIEIADEIGALIEANPTSFYELEFQALAPMDWKVLRRQHPPRDNVKDDAGLYNVDSFPDAAIAACMIEPEPTDEVMAFLKDRCSTGEWEQTTMKIWNLNEGARIAPKLRQPSQSRLGSVDD